MNGRSRNGMRETGTLTSFTVGFIWRAYRQEVERTDRKWKVSYPNNMRLL